MVSTVKDAKKKDVESLLNAIGVPQNVKTFYNDALAEVNDVASDSNDE